MIKIDRDKAKVQLTEVISNALCKGELSCRDFYIGDETISLMAESALNVFLAVEDVQVLMEMEGIK